jgi:hypothetical protein
VYTLELRSRRCARLEVATRVRLDGGVETREHRFDPLRAFRMMRPGIVRREPRISRDEQHERRLLTGAWFAGLVLKREPDQ